MFFAAETPAVLILTLCFALVLLRSIEEPVAAREIGSDANLCAEINSLQPGEILTLMPGDYRGPCKIRSGGIRGFPIVIQGQSTTEKPRIVYEGQDGNVFEIMADYVTLRGLKIGPTRRNVAGVRILAQAGIAVEDCEFSQLGGIAIALAVGCEVARELATKRPENVV